MIFVSKDGERSMNTYLGISSELGPQDVSDDVAGDTDYLFLEGYLYDKPKGKEAFERAAKLCQQAGGRAGIALSDPFCVDRHRDDFRRLVKDLDYVIGNEHEWSSLYQTDLETALAQAVQDAGVVVCTRSGEEVILARGQWFQCAGWCLLMPQARGTNLRQASSMGLRRAKHSTRLAVWAAPPQPRSSAITVRGQKPISRRSFGRKGFCKGT